MKGSAGLRLKAAPYLFISPFLVACAVFWAYPMFYGFWLSLHTGFDALTFAGFANYARGLEDEKFWLAMWNGTKLAAGSLLLLLPIALAVAMLISLPLVSRRKGFFATFFFAPHITSAVAVALVFGLIFNRDFGALNAVLTRLGLEPVGWLQDPAWTLPSLLILVVWRYLGIYILFFMAGLQNVPRELIESAKIDGAGPFQRFRNVTLPMLKPILSFIVFQAIVFSYSLFAEAYLLAGKGTGLRDSAGPENSLLFPTMHLYSEAFRFQNFSYSAALGYWFMLLLLLVSLLQLRMFRLNHPESR